MTRVSVVIPTCDRPLFLERALQSVCEQERLPEEIIVVDDGAPYAALETRNAVEKFRRRALRLVSNTCSKGASGARNSGAALASGTVLAFLDDDDEWLPAYLSTPIRRFESEALDVMCTDLLYRYDDASERPGMNAPDALVVNAFPTRNPGLIGSNLIIRPALYRALGGFDESLRTSEDMDFGIRLSLH